MFLSWNLGPSLNMPLGDHSMVPLGLGQAVIGGWSGGSQTKTYYINCANRNCMISTLIQELSFPRARLVVIPIPDTISGCITGGKISCYIRPLKWFLISISLWCGRPRDTGKSHYQIEKNLNTIIGLFEKVMNWHTLYYRLPASRIDWRWILSRLYQQ